MQSKTHSLIEVLLNIGSGFVISVLLQQYLITPIYHLPTSGSQNITITIIFTVVSVARSYFFRRLANYYHIRSVK